MLDRLVPIPLQPDSQNGLGSPSHVESETSTIFVAFITSLCVALQIERKSLRRDTAQVCGT